MVVIRRTVVMVTQITRAALMVRVGMAHLQVTHMDTMTVGMEERLEIGVEGLEGEWHYLYWVDWQVDFYLGICLTEDLAVVDLAEDLVAEDLTEDLVVGVSFNFVMIYPTMYNMYINRDIECGNYGTLYFEEGLDVASYAS